MNTPPKMQDIDLNQLNDAHYGNLVAFDCSDRRLTIQVDEMPSGKKPGHRLGAKAVLIFLPDDAN